MSDGARLVRRCRLLFNDNFGNLRDSATARKEKDMSPNERRPPQGEWIGIRLTLKLGTVWDRRQRYRPTKSCADEVRSWMADCNCRWPLRVWHSVRSIAACHPTEQSEHMVCCRVSVRRRPTAAPMAEPW